MKLRFPKRGFRSGRFNNDTHLESINLEKIAYFIEKGVIDSKETITMKLLLEKGIVTKIKHGIKILGKGANKIAQLGVPINIEANDATHGAIQAINETGGQIFVNYRTPLILRQYLKPHKFPEYVELKTPMPPPKKVHKLEKLKSKGLKVEYPSAPWFTDNLEAITKEKAEREKRMANAQFSDILPKYPADRSPGVNSDKLRYERKQLWRISPTK